MANPYFSNLPEFLYVNRTKEGRSEGDYSAVVNLFKRAKLREDIFQDLVFFTKFNVKGDDRPDNVAESFYGDSNLDWVVLLSNNIINVQSEWPLSQADFFTYLSEKYPDEINLYSGIHHYESSEVKTSDDVVIIPSGIRVGVGQSVTFFDDGINQQVTRTNIASTITNYMHEQKLNDKKREIFLLKPEYINLMIDDLQEIMTYKKGSTQFLDRTLIQGDNIRLYD